MENTLKKIMLVDDNVTNLKIGRGLLAEAYNVFTLPSGERLFQLLVKVRPDLILLDVEMPEMNGYEVLRKLKAAPETQDIPVIFLTAINDAAKEREGLAMGAVDFISKPFSPQFLLDRVAKYLPEGK